MEQSIQKWTMRNLRKTAFKGCLPQILLGPFLNTLFHIILKNQPHSYFSNVEFEQSFLSVYILELCSHFQFHFPDRHSLYPQQRVQFHSYFLMGQEFLPIHYLLALKQHLSMNFRHVDHP